MMRHRTPVRPNFRHQQEGHEKGERRANLYGGGVNTDFPPRFGFIRTGTRITSIKLLVVKSGQHGHFEVEKGGYLGCVYKNTVVSAVAHEVGVADMVFDETSTQDNHARLFSIDCPVVDGPDILGRVKRGVYGHPKSSQVPWTMSTTRPSFW